MKTMEKTYGNLEGKLKVKGDPSKPRTLTALVKTPKRGVIEVDPRRVLMETYPDKCYIYVLAIEEAPMPKWR